MANIVLGFDPGGRNDRGPSGNFGWSICQMVDGHLERLKTGLARDAVDARDQVRTKLDALGKPTILAAGIDAPLFWGRRGNRRVDKVVRNALKKIQSPAHRVMAVNSLQGAVTVQGPLLGWYLRAYQAGLPLTEAHPAAMWELLQHQEGSAGTVAMVTCLIAGLTDHKRDATLAAVSAWAMEHQPPGWSDLYNRECCPVQPFDTPVSYWMPIP